MVVLSVRVAVIALLLSGMFARATAAQSQLDSFAQLPKVLEIGSVVYVEDDSGQRVKGRLWSLSGSSLTIKSGPKQRSFAADRLVRVSQVDSKLNGFLIGLAAGAVPGLMLGYGIDTYCLNESPHHCPSAYLIFGGWSAILGGWIGSAIDGAIDGETVVFAKSQVSSAARVRLTPTLYRRGTGLAISVKF